MADLATKVESLEEGDKTTFAKLSDTVQVYYRGTLASNGKEFDSNFDKDKPLEFQVGAGKLVPGFEEPFTKGAISLNEKVRLRIPSERAYQSHGYPDGDGGYAIPPDSDLIFEVKVVSIKTKEEIQSEYDLSWCSIGKSNTQKKAGKPKKKKKKKKK